MRRREFLAIVGSAAAWPAGMQAQPALLPVIGFLNAASSDGYAERLRGFRQGLRDVGFVENENVAVEYRWAENQSDRLQAMATDLVRRRVAAIVATGGNSAVDAAKDATTTIPVLFVTPDDPLKLGYVTSIARPDGNLTGINFLGTELNAKRLELLLDLVPAAKRVAVLWNPVGSASEIRLNEVRSAANAMGLQIQVYNASSSREIDTAFAAMARQRADAFLFIPDPTFNGRRVQLVHLATRHAIPAMYWQREFAEAGGLGCVDGFDQDKAECESDKRSIIQRCLLATQCDAFEPLELPDCLLDTGATFVENLRKEDRNVFGVGSIRNCRTYSALTCGLAV